MRLTQERSETETRYWVTGRCRRNALLHCFSYVQLASQLYIIAILQHALLELVQCNIYPQDVQVWRLDTICRVHQMHTTMHTIQTQVHAIQYTTHGVIEDRLKYSSGSCPRLPCHQVRHHGPHHQQWFTCLTDFSNVQLWWNHNKRLIVCWCENNVPRKCHQN